MTKKKSETMEQSPPEKPAPAETPAAPSQTEAALALDTVRMQRAETWPLTPHNPDPQKRRVSTSIDLSKPEAWKQAYRAITAQDVRAEETIQGAEVLNVRDWLCHDVETLGEDGEIQRWVRVVLIEEDGRRIACGSEGILAALHQISMCHQRAPWTPALKCRIQPIRSRNARTYYVLDVL